jgi:LuxR family transcriptional regulator, regulator of acetate metabolism
VGQLDASVVTERAVREFGALVGTDATAVALREAPDLLVMRTGWRVRNPEVRRGLRIPMDDGVGGRVLRCGRPVSVEDLGAESFVSARLVDTVVHTEGVHAILGAPIRHRRQVIGVLYAVNRAPGHLGDRARALALEFAASLGPVLGSALQFRHTADLATRVERERIARDVHQRVGSLLFGIGTAAQRARQLLTPDSGDLVGQLETLEAQASAAASSLRDVLRALGTRRCEGGGLPATVAMDVDWFSSSTGLAADLAVIGEPAGLTTEQESAVLAVVREGLHNVARHAQASSVLVTLHCGAETTDVFVQDDGRGLPEDFVPCDVPRDGLHYGLASLRQRLARAGGELMLQRNQDGGMTLHGSIRHPATEPNLD